jgi:hypothetical protein
MFRVLVLVLSIAFVGCSGSSKKETSEKSVAEQANSAAQSHSAEAKSSAPAKAAGKADPAKAAATVEKSTEGTTVCTYEDIRREVAVVETGERCVVEYTKDGEKREIGSGLPKSPVCQGIAEKVKSNLESNGYKCE